MNIGAISRSRGLVRAGLAIVAVASLAALSLPGGVEARGKQAGPGSTGAYGSAGEHGDACLRAGGTFESGGGASHCTLPSGAESVCYWPSGMCTYYYPPARQAPSGTGIKAPTIGGGVLSAQ